MGTLWSHACSQGTQGQGGSVVTAEDSAGVAVQPTTNSAQIAQVRLPGDVEQG